MEFKPHDIVWTPESTSRFWGYINSNSSLNDIYFAKSVGQSVVSLLAAKTPLENKSILDFGCGPGYLFKHLNKTLKNFSYFGLDFSSDSVERLKESFKSEKNFKDAFFVSSYPTSIKQTFDVIICCEVLEHLNNQGLSEITAEFKRLLPKGGTLFITVPNDEDLTKSKVMCPDCGVVFHKWQHQRTWNKSTITSHFEANGFTTVAVLEKNFYSNPLKTTASELVKDALKMKRKNLVWMGTLN